MSVAETTCCIVGGGPAGVMLGLLYARAGIDVLVLEKHGDFLRDFRGDTVHPPTMTILDEIGVGERLRNLALHRSPHLSFFVGSRMFTFAEFTALRHRHPYLGFIPHSDLLDLLAQEASRYPTFRLVMRAEVTEMIEEHDRIVGVRYRHEGETHEVRSYLTVAADGRHSLVRREARLTTREFSAPMDVLWFRLSRRDTDPTGVDHWLARGGFIGLIDRNSYYQAAYMVAKGTSEEIETQGMQRLRAEVARIVPLLQDRVDELQSWDQVNVLSVRVDRLRRWYRPGLLCIGDAAHAMSPIGGVGINLAIQDAVAAANILGEPLRNREVTQKLLAKVQRRRMLPTALMQGIQRMAQRRFIEPLLSGRRKPSPPLPARVLLPRVRAGRHFVAWLIGVGPRPEHVHQSENATLPKDREGESSGRPG